MEILDSRVTNKEDTVQKASYQERRQITQLPMKGSPLKRVNIYKVNYYYVHWGLHSVIFNTFQYFDIGW